ncbi:MAG: hypothetical protein RL357_898 [Pseudomonadota bacterium]|jgi:uncharacterized protein (TIGR00369 family)
MSAVEQPLEWPRIVPFAQHLGFELMRFENGEAHIRLRPGREHENSFDVVHGGALMTLLDVTMAHAIRSAETDDVGCATIEMKTSFMRGAVGEVTAKGRLLHRTSALAFAEATIMDAQGRPCCHATGTFKVFSRMPKAFKHKQI